MGTFYISNPHLSSHAGFGTLNEQVAGLHRAVPSAALDKAYSISLYIICMEAKKSRVFSGFLAKTGSFLEAV